MEKPLQYTIYKAWRTNETSHAGVIKNGLLVITFFSAQSKLFATKIFVTKVAVGQS